MLAACLQSIVGQVQPAEFQPIIIVVDNESEPNNKPIFDAAIVASRFPAHYIHQPRRGISQARNAALRTALGFGAEWLAFIDDDEIADLEWLANLMAPEYRSTPVLYGNRRYAYPQPKPFWLVSEKPDFAEGYERDHCSTANVRFTMDLVRGGILFNEQLGSMGGEDYEFFLEASRRGYAIKGTTKAITIEATHPERLTYFGQVYRSYWTGARITKNLIEEKGTSAAKIQKVPSMLLRGGLDLVTSPFYLPRGLATWKFRMLRGGKKIGKALGHAAARLGHLPKPYERIVGH